MPYNSYNEYIVKNNLLVLIGIYAVNYFASYNFRIFSFFLSFRIVQIAEWVLGLLAVYNIGYACREFIVPYVSALNIPYKDEMFTPGPLVDTLRRIYNFFTTEINKPSTTNSTTPVADAKKDEKDPRISDVDRRLLSLFLNKPSTDSDRPQQSYLTTLNPVANNANSKPSLFQQTLFANKASENKETIEGVVATSELKRLYTNSLGQSNASVFTSVSPNANTTTSTTLGGTFGATTSSFANPASTSAAPTIPKLRYTPCLKPPLRPAVHRERLLWYLSPTAEVIEDFKIEQIIEYQKLWNTFNDRADYDKLTQILLTKIFSPLAQSIDQYNALLASKNINVANCPPKTVALSMTVPHIGTAFNLSDIAAILSMENYSTSEAKTYIVERIKELGSGNRMAAFRFTPKYAGMPTDSEIIMHAFKCYLAIKEPYAIPPLIEQEGDVFKFLLIYIKITPELEHWGLFTK